MPLKGLVTRATTRQTRMDMTSGIIDTALETYAVNFSIGEGLAGRIVLRTHFLPRKFLGICLAAPADLRTSPILTQPAVESGKAM